MGGLVVVSSVGTMGERYRNGTMVVLFQWKWMEISEREGVLSLNWRRYRLISYVGIVRLVV